MTDDATAALAGSWTMHTRVESWLGEELLAEDIPVSAGTEDGDRSLVVPERVTLTVPRLDRGTSWDPTGDPEHPLAPYGQRLRVSVGVEITGGVVEWVQRGWFLVTDSMLEADTISVTGAGLLTLIDEARFVAPFQPSSTLAATVRALVEPALTVDIDATLTDRAVPSNISWDEDRIGALMELLDAWPADAMVTPDGYLSVVPATESTTSVLSLTDGAGGTVVQWGGSATRDGAASCVVARGQATDGAAVQGVAYDSSPSPTEYGGPFNPLPVPYFYFSPLLTTNTQCRTAAATIVARRRRAGGRRITALAVPHPGLQTGDLVTVTATGLDAVPALVEAISMPLTPSSGAMALTLQVTT